MTWLGLPPALPVAGSPAFWHSGCQHLPTTRKLGTGAAAYETDDSSQGQEEGWLTPAQQEPVRYQLHPGQCPPSANHVPGQSPGWEEDEAWSLRPRTRHSRKKPHESPKEERVWQKKRLPRVRDGGSRDQLLHVHSQAKASRRFPSPHLPGHSASPPGPVDGPQLSLSSPV